MTAPAIVDAPWEARAVCRVDPELWFPSRPKERAEARHICLHHCPVLAQCHAQTVALQANPETRGLRFVSGGIYWDDLGKRAPRQAAAPRCPLCRAHPPTLTQRLAALRCPRCRADGGACTDIDVCDETLAKRSADQ